MRSIAVGYSNIGPSQTVTPASVSCADIPSTTVRGCITLVTGEIGCCTATITVTDAAPPVITCPANQFAGADLNTCAAPVSFSIGATDNCPGVTVTSSPLSGSSFGVGTTTVNAQAQDSSNLVSTCSFSVTVTDDELPSITCPADIALTASGCTGSVIYSENFNSGQTPSGWTHGRLSGSVDGWEVRLNTGGIQPVTLSSYAFGAPNNGPEMGQENSYLVTPSFSTSVANGSVILFTSYSFNENVPYDLESVQVSLDGGAWTTLLTSSYPLWSIQGTATQFSALLPTGADSTVIRFVYNTVDDLGTFPAAGWFIDDFLVMDPCVATPVYTVTSNDNCPGQTVNQTGGYASNQAHPIGTTIDAFTVTDAPGNTASCYFRVNVMAFVPLEPKLNAELMMYVRARIHWSNFASNGNNAVDIFLRHPISKARILDIVLNYSGGNEYFFYPQKVLPGDYEIVVTATGQAGGIGVVVSIVVPN